MDTIGREKNRIKKREQTAQVAFSLLLLTAFLAPAILVVSLTTAHVSRTLAAFNSCCLAPLFFFLFFLIVVLGISILGPYMQKTQRQKQNWLNAYGLYILALVTRHPGENALVIGGRGSESRRNAFYTVFLNWQDPQTGQCYSFRVNTRFSAALRNLSEGALYPVQFDPGDPSFFVVPESSI
jgi:hypothetical protein